MAYVTEGQLKQALRPMLGNIMVEQTALCSSLAEVIRAFVSYRESFDTLADQLESVIFNTLYEALGDRMTVRLDSGETCRIRMADLPVLADEAIGAMFDRMDVYSVNYTKLKDYAMRRGSLSAMRVIYQKYADYQPADERALMVRVIRENNLPARYEAWLKPESEG